MEMLLGIGLTIIGISLLKSKLGVSQQELTLMFTGGMLLGVIRDLTSIILLVISGFSGPILGGLLLSLLINSGFSYYFMKQSNLI